MNKFKLIFALFLIPLFFISEAVSYSDLVAVKNKNGMYQASFKLERGGVVNVNLPSDMALKENVSGSMVYSGNLSQFELLLEGKIVPIVGGNFNITVPSNVSTGVLNVLLRYSNGIEIGRAFFPVNIVKLKDFKSSSEENAFTLPVYGSSGIPVDVEGAFDGNYRNTIATLSGKRLNILAESTTRTVFVTSNDHSGPGVLKLSELGKSAQTKFTNLVVVKVEERVQQSQPTLGYEQKDFQKLSETNDYHPQEIRKKGEEILPALAKNNQPKIIGGQDNTLLTENPANRVNVASGKTKPVVSKPITPKKDLDSSVVKNDLDQQFGSKFYSNEPVDVKKKEFASSNQSVSNNKTSVISQKLTSSSDTNKSDQRNIISKSSELKTVTENDEEKMVKKDASKELESSSNQKSATLVPKVKQTNTNDFSEVKKDLNEQFFSKLNTPESEKKEKTLKKELTKAETNREKATVSNKKVNEQKIKEPIKVKKEAKSFTTEKSKQKNTKTSLDNKTPDKTKKIEKKKQISTNKVAKEDSKNITNKDSKKIDEKTNKVAKVVKTPVNKPSVSKYTPLEKIDIAKVEKTTEINNKKSADKVSKKIEKKPSVTQYTPLDLSKVEKSKKELESNKNKKDAVHTVVPENKKTDLAKAKIPSPQKKSSTKKTKGDFCIQLASFKKQSEVDYFLSKMEPLGYKADVKKVDLPGKGRWNRVRVCDFNSRADAENFSKGINKSRLNISSVLVTVY